MTAIRQTNGSPINGKYGDQKWIFEQPTERIGFRWFDEIGVGYYQVLERDKPYDQAYFDKYVEYSKTNLGWALTWRRLTLVQHYSPVGRLVDVGIGCGQFVRAYGDAYGYDVNPVGVKWLRAERRYFNPYAAPFDTACFWDSLEHIEDPTPLLANVRRYVFVSVPIFRNVTHVLSSKHYRPDEHYWYFTLNGLCFLMARAGFHCLECNDMESELGREDIKTFVFKRV